MTEPVRTRTVGLVLLIAALHTYMLAGGVDWMALMAQHADLPLPIERPRDAQRTMEHEDPIIRRALAVLGQSLNPVVVVGPETIREIYGRVPGAGAPRAALNAFRAPGDPSDRNIYVNGDSAVYRNAAETRSALALLSSPRRWCMSRFTTRTVSMPPIACNRTFFEAG